eukprot:679914-Rhodomonas_salina.5
MVVWHKTKAQNNAGWLIARPCGNTAIVPRGKAPWALRRWAQAQPPCALPTCHPTLIARAARGTACGSPTHRACRPHTRMTSVNDRR